MAAVREGNQAVLLVVDMQVDVMRNAWQAEQVVANAVRAVERAREARIPVIWVQHSDEDFPYGTPGWE